MAMTYHRTVRVFLALGSAGGHTVRVSGRAVVSRHVIFMHIQFTVEVGAHQVILAASRGSAYVYRYVYG